MPEPGYRRGSLPTGLLEQVENLLEKLEKEGFDHGYKTTSEFVKDTVRRRVEELRQIYYISDARRREIASQEIVLIDGADIKQLQDAAVRIPNPEIILNSFKRARCSTFHLVIGER